MLRKATFVKMSELDFEDITRSSCRSGCRYVSLYEACITKVCLAGDKGAAQGRLQGHESRGTRGMQHNTQSLVPFKSCPSLPKAPRSNVTESVLQDNIFEWHFAIRGPPDTEFEVRILTCELHVHT